MSYTILIEELAEKDIDEAFLWFELQKEGLGFEFIESISETFEKIMNYPFANQLAYKNLRKTVIKRFPYLIFYFVDNDLIHIVAVMHSRRNPNFWKQRLK